MRGIIFTACLVSCLAANGCGSIAKQDAGTSSDVTTEATTETVSEATPATTEAAKQTTTEALAEPTTAGSSETETQTSAIQAGPSTEQAQELVRALDTLERLIGCGLQNDADSVWTVNGTAYHKVTDDRFADTAAQDDSRKNTAGLLDLLTGCCGIRRSHRRSRASAGA